MCDSRKICEDLTMSLNLKGFKANNYISKTDVQKFDLTQGFIKGQFDILVLQSTQTLNRQLKEKLKIIIYYNLPRSIDDFLMDLSGASTECAVHGFICDEDCFQVRNDIASELISRSKIEILLYKIFVLKENRRGSKKLEAAQSQMDFLNVVHQPAENLLERTGAEMQQDIQSIKINELCTELELRRENFLQILYLLHDKSWLEIVNIVPIQASLRLISQAALDSSGCAQQDLLKLIQENSVKGKGGNFKFDYLPIASALCSTPFEVLRQLKKLANEKVIVLDTLEEAVCLKILRDLDVVEVDAKIVEIYKQLRDEQETSLQSVDSMFTMAKIGSYNTVDQTWKYTKFKNVAQKDRSKLFDKVPKVSSMIKKKTQQFVLDEFISAYLLQEKAQNCEALFTSYVDNVKSQLPFVKVSNIREKQNVTKDLQILVEHQLDQQFILDLERDSPAHPFIYDRAKVLVMILQGLSSNSQSMSVWKGDKLWKKYYKYDYFELMDLAINILNNYRSDHVTDATKKKVKLQ